MASEDKDAEVRGADEDTAPADDSREAAASSEGVDENPYVESGSKERRRRRRQPSLARRIFAALAVVSSLAAISVFVFATVFYQSTAIEDAGRMLESECQLVKTALRSSNNDPLSLLTLGIDDVRVTLVSADGTVLYDNQNSIEGMPNHADRPEIAEALATGSGSAERESDTEGEVSIYRAIRLENGNVVRLSVERDSTAEAIRHDTLLMASVVLVVIAVCWLLSNIVAERLLKPVLRIDPANPEPHETYAEVEPLVERLSEQQAELAGQVVELQGNVVELRDDAIMRREFTSNVTHELKTPLASISGAAELIRDGIAKPEDVPEFAGRIYDEAAHMTTLVNDILTLSKLDESERAGDRELLGSTEPVDLYQVLQDVAGHLKTTAETAGVELACSGESVLVEGVPLLLDELAFNLCDNAIRYNREDGRVDAWAGLEDGVPVLRVSDTGIGIPEDAQAKVFERFYRVDGSRARETGGTGLGLAIVKHAATYHGASISLESVEGEGTTITVRFPPESIASV